jgi:hypothetical protein
MIGSHSIHSIFFNYHWKKRQFHQQPMVAAVATTFLFCLGLKKRHELCRNCVSFLELPVKKKKQEEMGKILMANNTSISNCGSKKLTLGPVVKVNTSSYYFMGIILKWYYI